MTDRPDDVTARGRTGRQLGEDEPVPVGVFPLGPPIEWDEVDPPLELDQGEQLTTRPISDEKSRWFIARWLLLITVVMGAAFLAVALLAPAAVWERVDRVATMVLLPFQTLLGTAVGWYFGGGKKKD